jgi:hypothetical protein
MAWTTPATRNTGDLITASIFNTDLVNNLSYLKSEVDARVEKTQTSVASFNAITKGGFYLGDTATTGSPTAEYHHLFHLGDATWAMQIASSFIADTLSYRRTSNGVWGLWQEIHCGDPYYTSYYVSSNVSISAWTPVTLTGYTSWAAGNWPTTPSAGHFTVPKTGKYLIKASIAYAVYDAGQSYGATICLTVSGTTYEIAQNRLGCVSTQQVVVPVLSIASLNAGDTISFRVFASTAHTNCIQINNSLTTHIEIIGLR